MYLPRRSRALMLFTAHQSAMHLATVGGLAVALPAMMAEFHVDVATVVWVQVAYSVALAGGTIPFGQLGPLVGRRRLVFFGQLADVAIMLVTVVAGSIYVIIVARFLSALVRVWPWLYLQVMSVGAYPPEQRGRILGLTRLLHGTALLVSVPLTGWVTDHWGWRWLFLGTAVVWVVLTVAIWLLLPADAWETDDEEQFELSRLDLPGGVLLMSGLAGVLFALQSFVRGQTSALGAVVGALGLVALVAFGFVERRAPSPLLYLPLFRIRDVFVSAMQAVCLGFVSGALVLLLPFLFIKGYGWTAAYAGGMLAFFHLARPPSGLVGGWLADRYGSWRVIAPAALAVLIGQLVVASLGVNPALGGLAGALLLLGLGEALASTANLRQIFSAMPRAHLALAPGTNLVLSLLGATLGQVLVAAALELGVAPGAPGTAEASLVSAASAVLLATSALFAVGMLLGQLIPTRSPAFAGPAPADAPADRSGSPGGR
jgi:MFS family permease